eukprot:scaffold11516_cov125-Isochrysis_galbana.AAC.1
MPSTAVTHSPASRLGSQAGATFGLRLACGGARRKPNCGPRSRSRLGAAGLPPPPAAVEPPSLPPPALPCASTVSFFGAATTSVGALRCEGLAGNADGRAASTRALPPYPHPPAPLSPPSSSSSSS